MAVFLDIDADFMFKPRTSGNSRIHQEMWVSPDDFVTKLRAAGLRWEDGCVTLFTDHKEAYFVWREWRAHRDTLVHVDAHSDMYDTFSWCLHCGNYLKKAVEEGMFSKVIWVAPDWLVRGGEWARWDIPFLTMSGARESGYRPGVNIGDGAGTISIKHGKVKFSVLSMKDFRMPNTRVRLVTVATSPLFVPSRETGAIRQLVEVVCCGASRVSVRPNIPLSLEEPRLKELLKVDFAPGGSPAVFKGGEARVSRRRSTEGFLWVEHRVIAEACSVHNLPHRA